MTPVQCCIIGKYKIYLNNTVLLNTIDKRDKNVVLQHPKYIVYKQIRQLILFSERADSRSIHKDDNVMQF